MRHFWVWKIRQFFCRTNWKLSHKLSQKNEQKVRGKLSEKSEKKWDFNKIYFIKIPFFLGFFSFSEGVYKKSCGNNVRMIDIPRIRTNWNVIWNISKAELPTPNSRSDILILTILPKNLGFLVIIVSAGRGTFKGRAQLIPQPLRRMTEDRYWLSNSVINATHCRCKCKQKWFARSGHAFGI